MEDSLTVHIFEHKARDVKQFPHRKDSFVVFRPHFPMSWAQWTAENRQVRLTLN